MKLNKNQAVRVLSTLGIKSDGKSSDNDLAEIVDKFDLADYAIKYVEHRRSKNNGEDREPVNVRFDSKTLWAIDAMSALRRDNETSYTRSKTLENAFWFAMQHNFFDLDEELLSNILKFDSTADFEKMLDEELKKSKDNNMLLSILEKKLKEYKK